MDDAGQADAGLADTGPGDAGPPAPDLEPVDCGPPPPDAAATDLSPLPDGAADDGGPWDGGGDAGDGSSALDVAPDAGGDHPGACLRDADCPAPQVCRLLPDPANPLAVTPRCGLAVGAGPPGADCGSDDACASGTCLAGACWHPCTAHADCPLDQRCRPALLVLDDRGTAAPDDDLTQEVLTCQAAPGPVCARNADCDAPQVCRAWSIPADGGLVELRCSDPLGGGGAGEPCVADGQCATGLCLDGSCWGACRDVADCAAGQLCGELLLPVAAGPRPVLPACFARPPGCLADSDCEAGQACRPYADAEQVQLVGLCLGDVGAGSAGQLCVANDDCRSGYCLATTDGNRCLGICRNDGDCVAPTRCYPDQLYVDLAAEGEPPRFDSLPACSPDIGSRNPCSSDGDCPGDEVCLPVPDRTRRSLTGICRTPLGFGGGPGELCFSSDALCRSGSCLDFYGIPLLTACLGLCVTDADCAAGTCQGVELTEPGFDPGPEDDLTDEVNLCVP